MNDSVNLHVERISEVPEAMARVRQMTGQEPLICIHIYAASFDQLKELFRARGSMRVVSVPEPKLATHFPGMFVDDFQKRPEPPELVEAREKLAQWSRHSTAYALEQRNHWRRQVEILLAAHLGEDAPPDTTPDD